MISNLRVQISPFVSCFSGAFQQIFNPHSAIRIPQSSTRWQAHLRDLTTAIHGRSGLNNLLEITERKEHPSTSSGQVAQSVGESIFRSAPCV
jgi:hypothetical protein